MSSYTTNKPADAIIQLHLKTSKVTLYFPARLLSPQAIKHPIPDKSAIAGSFPRKVINRIDEKAIVSKTLSPKPKKLAKKLKLAPATKPRLMTKTLMEPPLTPKMKKSASQPKTIKSSRAARRRDRGHEHRIYPGTFNPETPATRK